LRKRLADNRLDIECDKSYVMVNVQSLIDDVFIEHRASVKDEKVPDVVVNISNIRGNVSDATVVAGNQNAVTKNNN